MTIAKKSSMSLKKGEEELNLFLNCAYRRLYSEARAHLFAIDAHPGTRLHSDVNFYTFLLSFVVFLPQDQLDKCKNLSLKDVHTCGQDEIYGDAVWTNRIRENIVKQFFNDALKELGDLNKAYGGLTKQNVVTNVLVYEIKKKYDKIKFEIYKAICENRLQDVLNMLTSIENSHGLRTKLFIIKRLCVDILTVQNRDIPIENEGWCISSSLDILVINHNYIGALHQYVKMIREKRKLNVFDYSIILLLEKVLAMCHQEDLGDLKRDNLFTILEELQKGNKDGAFTLLSKYLRKNGLSEYEYLVRDMIEISFGEEDWSFMDPCLMISRLVTGSFILRVGYYIDSIYRCLKDDNLTSAILYLKLVRDILKNGHSNIPENVLYAKIEEIERLIASRKQEEDFRMSFKEKRRSIDERRNR